MTEREAVEALQGSALIPAIQGSMSYIKELRDKCLDADIPVRVDRQCGSGGG